MTAEVKMSCIQPAIRFVLPIILVVAGGGRSRSLSKQVYH